MTFVKKVTKNQLFLPLFSMVLVMLVNIIYDVANGNPAFNFFSISINNGILYGRLIDILNRGSEAAILALGMTLVVSASAGTDISVGSVMSLAGGVCCVLLAGFGNVNVNEYAIPLWLGVVAGILVACLLNLNQAKTLLPAINEGANGSMGAIMNTACAVGFGSVVKVVPGFASLTSIALNMPGSILFSEAVAVNLLAGATGSASGGMSIALSALGPKYAEMAAGNTGVLEALHRIASISSGGLDTLPHNGAVLTLLAVSNCTHKESYIDICITTCIIPLVSSLGLALIWGLFL